MKTAAFAFSLSLLAGLGFAQTQEFAVQQWNIQQIADPITDAVSVAVTTQSLIPLSCSGNPAVLAVRCIDGRLDVSLFHDCRISPTDLIDLTLRLGENSPTTMPRQPILAGHAIALWFGAAASDALFLFWLNHRIAMRFQDRAGQDQTAVFNTQFFGMAAGAGRMVCDFPFRSEVLAQINEVGGVDADLAAGAAAAEAAANTAAAVAAAAAAVDDGVVE